MSSRLHLLSEEIVLWMIRQRRMCWAFSWNIENRLIERNIDCFENSTNECSDFDIRNVRIDDDRIDRKTDFLSKRSDFDMKWKEKHSIEMNILNNSEFDENFEIDLWVIWIDFVIEIESFRVRYLTWNLIDSETFEWMLSSSIRKCSLENVNQDYFRQSSVDYELSSCWLSWSLEKSAERRV